MSGQLAAEEPYTTLFESAVTAVDGRKVGLETSYFYAAGGGQPSDRGTIADVTVTDVEWIDGEPVHVLAEEPRLREGHQALCRIDWDHRMYCMRAHTASHVLFGAGRRLLDDVGYAGFDIGQQKVRVDLSTPTTIDDETLVELERLVNRVVWESRSVQWESVPRETVLDDDAVAYNEATEEGILSTAASVRVVTIGDVTDTGEDAWDAAVCGGTHVRNTREIGPITVLGRSNPGDGVTRVEFAVGPTGIDHRLTEKRAVLEARRALGTDVSSVPEAVDDLQRDGRVANERIRELGASLVQARVDAVREERFERDGESWIVATVPELGPNELADHVGEVAGCAADVVVLLGTEPRCVVVGSSGETPASVVVERLTDEFGGGGGGSATVAQGGGVDADVDDVRGALATETGV